MRNYFPFPISFKYWMKESVVVGMFSVVTSCASGKKEGL